MTQIKIYIRNSERYCIHVEKFQSDRLRDIHDNWESFFTVKEKDKSIYCRIANFLIRFDNYNRQMQRTHTDAYINTRKILIDLITKINNHQYSKTINLVVVK